ncbi:hypothetical protein STPH2_1398 [Streptomyces sp. KO7888]|nr:hypothetical protein [Streptomyces sp. KO7888]
MCPNACSDDCRLHTTTRGQGKGAGPAALRRPGPLQPAAARPPTRRRLLRHPAGRPRSRLLDVYRLRPSHLDPAHRRCRRPAGSSRAALCDMGLGGTITVYGVHAAWPHSAGTGSRDRVLDFFTTRLTLYTAASWVRRFVICRGQGSPGAAPGGIRAT